MPSANPFRRKPAFSLVELLVVLGIISVLIAILLPTLNRVRDHANRAKCAANLRSIGQAMTMYTQQYGYYPACWALVGPGEYYAIWPTRLRAFLGGDRNAFYCPSQDARCQWKNDPAAPGPRANGVMTHFGYAENEPLLTSGTWFSYGYNLWGTEMSSWWDGQKGLGFMVDRNAPKPFSWREVRASSVRRASEKIAIADSTADGQWDVAIHPTTGDPRIHPGRVHMKGANVLFCDGHVSWYAQEELIFRIDAAGEYFHPKTYFMWNVTSPMPAR